DFVYSKIVTLLVSAIIILLFLEECLFRLPLKKNRFSSTALVLGILYGLFSIEYHMWLSIPIILVNVYMLYQYRGNKRLKFPISLILIYIIFFTFIHMVNYNKAELETLTWYEII